MAGTLLALLVAGALVYVLVFRRGWTTVRSAEIKSLAVLPLKSLDAGDNFLGLGIADAVIRRINQTGELIVRPTSAVRRYLNEDTDALTAALQLNADAVLEGSVQRASDRLRVSVNLLRTSDGASLWADNFDMRMTDIFAIQDTVAQQVASRLRLQLDPSQQAQLKKRYTSNPVAYEFYMKGLYSFDQRMSSNGSQFEATIDSFRRATEADSNFALAHANLAYAYATKAVFLETTEPVWAERAKEEINRAQTLDPQLAETHLARFVLLYSVYEGYQTVGAVREVLLAQQLNPNIGHGELGYLYLHIGLEDFAAHELQRAFDIDPTSEFVKGLTLVMYELGGKFDEWLAAHERFFPNQPISVWYLLGKGRLEEAQKAIDLSAKNQGRIGRSADDMEFPKKALLFALKGDFRSAEAEIPSILDKHPVKDPIYHHHAYDIACIFALEGKSVEAVKWLREAVATGFSPYPLFERDAYLNRIRQAPEFIQFMAEMKTRWEGYRREFDQVATR
jgi:TolB-like protein